MLTRASYILGLTLLGLVGIGFAASSCAIEVGDPSPVAGSTDSALEPWELDHLKWYIVTASGLQVYEDTTTDDGSTDFNDSVTTTPAEYWLEDHVAAETYDPMSGDPAPYRWEPIAPTGSYDVASHNGSDWMVWHDGNGRILANNVGWGPTKVRTVYDISWDGGTVADLAQDPTITSMEITRDVDGDGSPETQQELLVVWGQAAASGDEYLRYSHCPLGIEWTDPVVSSSPLRGAFELGQRIDVESVQGKSYVAYAIKDHPIWIAAKIRIVEILPNSNDGIAWGSDTIAVSGGFFGSFGGDSADLATNGTELALVYHYVGGDMELRVLDTTNPNATWSNPHWYGANVGHSSNRAPTVSFIGNRWHVAWLRDDGANFEPVLFRSGENTPTLDLAGVGGNSPSMPGGLSDERMVLVQSGYTAERPSPNLVFLGEGVPNPLAWNFVFVSDGYQEDELAEFADLVEATMASFRTMSPFRQAMRDGLANFWRFDAPSREHGLNLTADIAAQVGRPGVWTDTAFGSYVASNYSSHVLAEDYSPFYQGSGHSAESDPGVDHSDPHGSISLRHRAYHSFEMLKSALAQENGDAPIAFSPASRAFGDYYVVVNRTSSVDLPGINKFEDVPFTATQEMARDAELIVHEMQHSINQAADSEYWSHYERFEPPLKPINMATMADVFAPDGSYTSHRWASFFPSNPDDIYVADPWARPLSEPTIPLDNYADEVSVATPVWTGGTHVVGYASNRFLPSGDEGYSRHGETRHTFVVNKSNQRVQPVLSNSDATATDCSAYVYVLVDFDADSTFTGPGEVFEPSSQPTSFDCGSETMVDVLITAPSSETKGGQRGMRVVVSEQPLDPVGPLSSLENGTNRGDVEDLTYLIYPVHYTDVERPKSQVFNPGMFSVPELEAFGGDYGGSSHPIIYTPSYECLTRHSGKGYFLCPICRAHLHEEMTNHAGIAFDLAAYQSDRTELELEWSQQGSVGSGACSIDGVAVPWNPECAPVTSDASPHSTCRLPLSTATLPSGTHELRFTPPATVKLGDVRIVNRNGAALLVTPLDANSPTSDPDNYYDVCTDQANGTCPWYPSYGEIVLEFSN